MPTCSRSVRIAPPARGSVAAVVAIVVALAARGGPAADDPAERTTPTTLLGGLAWLPDGPIVTAGADGLIYRVDPGGSPTAKFETEPSTPHAKRVRLVLARAGARDRVVLTVDLDGVARAWDESSQPFAVYPPGTVASSSLGPEVLDDDGSLVFALGRELLRWAPTSDTSVEATKLADLPETVGELAVLETKGRVAWLDASGRRLRFFDPGGTAADHGRGGLGLPERTVALAVPTGLDGFDAVGASGRTRRFRFPEDRTPPDFAKARFPRDKTARGRSHDGRFLVVEDDEHKVRRLPIDPTKAEAPEASAAAIHDGTDPGRRVEALSAGGPEGGRVVALLHEGTGGTAARLRDIAKLDDPAWRDVAKDLDRDRGGTLAVSDSGQTAALVARSAAGGADAVLHRFDLAAAMPTPVPVPPPSVAGTFSYGDTRFVTFLPGSESAWLLATRAGATRTLRLVAVDGAGMVRTTPIAQEDRNLAFAPESIADGTDRFLIASAWAGGAVRVDRLDAGAATRVGEVNVDPTNPGAVAALALKPDGRRLAALAVSGLGAATLVVWDVQADRLVELERIARPETIPAEPRFLAWRGDDLALASADGGELVVVLAAPAAVDTFAKPTFGPPIDSVSRAAIAPDGTLAALSGDPANRIWIAQLDGNGPPSPFATITTSKPPAALEFVSARDLATVDSSDGQLIVYRATDAAPATFNPLPAWPDTPPTDANDRVAAIRRLADRSLVARLQGGRLVLLQLPDPGTVEAPRPTIRRETEAIGRPAASVPASGGPRVAAFMTQGSGRRLGVWLAATSPLQQVADSPFPKPVGTLNTITAAAWTVDTRQLRPRPAFGLADGRLWLPKADDARAYVAVEPPGMPAPKGILVRALAHHPRQPWLAVAWTLVGNRVSIRKTTDAANESQSLDLGDAGVPTALAFDPTGRFLAAATAQGRIRVWKVEAAGDGSAITFTALPEPAKPLGPSLAAVEALAFGDPRDDGTARLAAIDGKGRVEFWDVSGDGTRIERRDPTTLPAGPGPNAGLAWEPGGDRVAAPARPGRVFILKAPGP